MFPSASDVRLWHVNNATVGGYTSSVTHGATANIAEGNFDAACRFPLQGEEAVAKRKCCTNQGNEEGSLV